MSQGQKILGGVGVLALVGFFVFIYGQFASQDQAGVVRNLETSEVRQGVSESVAIPATPDATVDDIVSDAVLNDEKAFQDEINGEGDAVRVSGDEINNLSQVYDESQF